VPEHEADSDEEMRRQVRLGINLGVMIVKGYDSSRAWWNLTTYEPQIMRVRTDMSAVGPGCSLTRGWMSSSPLMHLSGSLFSPQ
jgi:hypothetical protein